MGGRSRSSLADREQRDPEDASLDDREDEDAGAAADDDDDGAARGDAAGEEVMRRIGAFSLLTGVRRG